MTDPRLPTVLLFLGQSEKADWRCKPWGWFYGKYLGFNVLITDYRGYGLSEGTAGGPNQEFEAYLDAEAAYYFVLAQGIEHENVIAHGCSLGGAYAAALGRFRGVEYVILDHTFTSIADVCANKVPFIPWDTAISSAYVNANIPPNPSLIFAQKNITTDGFNTLNKVSQMEGNIFVISGKNDTVAPSSFGEKLVKARYPDNKEKQKESLLVVEGGHERRGFIFDEDRKALKQFWEALWTHLDAKGFRLRKISEDQYETFRIDDDFVLLYKLCAELLTHT